MFTMVGSKPHSARKRMLSNLYSKSYLQKSPHLAAVSRTIILDRLLPSIASSARAGTTIEAHGFNNATTMDFITGYIFGLEAAPNFLEHPAEANSWLHAYQCRKPYEFYHQEVPRLTAIACAIGFPLVPKWCDEANQQMEDWGMELCKRADENIGMTEPGAEPLVYRQLKQALQKRIECMSDPEAAKEAAAHLPNDVACELFDQYTAGHETSAVALTYLYWELSRQPALQTALRDELKTPTLNIRPRERNGDRQLPDPKQLDSLPLLDAILTETLRLHAPIPGQQPRVTPAPSTKLGPYEHVPPSIRVGAQAYSLHRNEEVFPEPEAFCPGRWLREKEGGDAGDTELEQRRRWFWAFGSGGRMCIGSNLALQGKCGFAYIGCKRSAMLTLVEIKLVVAAVYSNYTTTIVDDNDIEAVDAYTVGPTGNKLVLKFKQVYAE